MKQFEFKPNMFVLSLMGVMYRVLQVGAALGFIAWGSFLGCRAAHAQELIVATGNLKSGTYSQMFTELNKYCQPSTIGIMIKQRETTGSVENLSLLLGNKVNAAWLQSDLLFMARAMDRSKTEPIKTIVGLHPEEVHIVARADTKKEGGYGIGSFKVGGTTVTYNTLNDLKGRPIGAVGGSVVTAKLISQMAGLDFNVIEYANNEALKAAIIANEVDAAVIVGGAPHALVASLSRQFRLIPIGQDTAEKLKDVYQYGSKLSYDNLGQAGVPTVATQALFVTRRYESAKMTATFAKLRKCFKDNLGDIKDALGTHAKWQDVQAANDGKWPLYEFQ